MYNKGFDNYISGNWKLAKEFFEKVEAAKGSIDPPTNNLLHFMEEHHFHAPQDWKGARSFAGGH